MFILFKQSRWYYYFTGSKKKSWYKCEQKKQVKSKNSSFPAKFVCY